MDASLSVVPVSRRVALARLGAGGLGLALAARGLGVAAQEATPEAIPPAVQAWADAWEAGDVDGLVALFTEDALAEDVPFGAAFRGQDEIRARAEAELAAFSEIEITISNAFQAGDWAAAEGTLSESYTGQAEGLPPGTGQRVEVRIVAIFELEGDLIRRQSNYFDALTFLTQLGVLGEPEGEGAPEEGTPMA